MARGKFVYGLSHRLELVRFSKSKLGFKQYLVELSEAEFGEIKLR